MDDLTPNEHRPLNETERGILDAILRRVDIPGADLLRDQIAVTLVTGGRPTSLNLSVGPGRPAADVPDGPLPIDALVEDEEGTYMGMIHVWIESGYLSAIEFGWVTDATPTELPPREWLRF